MNLIFDGNYLFYKTLFIFSGYSSGKRLLEDEKDQAMFMRKIATDMSHAIRSFGNPDRIVFTIDSRSWRKDIEIEDGAYKGTRTKDESTVDWDTFYKLMNEYGVNSDDVRYKFHNANQVKIIDDIILDIGIGFGWLGDEQYWSPQHHGDHMTRAYAFMEVWRCMYGQPVQISCSNFSEWLKDSVWLAEMKVYYDSQH